MRWHYRDPFLLWLFPLSYAAHIAEEWWAGGGFTRWLAALGFDSLGPGALLAWNGIGLTSTIIGCRLAARRDAFGWIAVTIAAATLLNAVTHLAASVVSGTYSPGLITGVTLWMPLGLLTLLRARDQASARTIWTGIAIGILIQVVTWTIALG
jgi:hypothetical protein